MPIEDFIISVFVWVDDTLKALFGSHKPWRTRGPAPRLEDSEVLTMELVGEFLGYDQDKGIYSYSVEKGIRMSEELPTSVDPWGRADEPSADPCRLLLSGEPHHSSCYFYHSMRFSTEQPEPTQAGRVTPDSPLGEMPSRTLSEYLRKALHLAPQVLVPANHDDPPAPGD